MEISRNTYNINLSIDFIKLVYLTAVARHLEIRRS